MLVKSQQLRDRKTITHLGRSSWLLNIWMLVFDVSFRCKQCPCARTSAQLCSAFVIAGRFLSMRVVPVHDRVTAVRRHSCRFCMVVVCGCDALIVGSVVHFYGDLVVGKFQVARRVLHSLGCLSRQRVGSFLACGLYDCFHRAKALITRW